MASLILDPVLFILLIFMFLSFKALSKWKRFLFCCGFSFVAILASPLPGLIYNLIFFKEKKAEGIFDGIIVLSGGVVHQKKSNGDFMWLSNSSRLHKAIELYKKGLAPTLIFTGKDELSGFLSESESMKAWALLVGVPDHAIIVESESKNTLEHATKLKGLLGGKEKRYLLISNPSHLVRSNWIFRDQGFSTIGVSANGKLEGLSIGKANVPIFYEILYEGLALSKYLIQKKLLWANPKEF